MANNQGYILEINAQRIGIVASLTVHILLLVLMIIITDTKAIPAIKTIQISFMQQDEAAADAWQNAGNKVSRPVTAPRGNERRQAIASRLIPTKKASQAEVVGLAPPRRREAIQVAESEKPDTSTRGNVDNTVETESSVLVPNASGAAKQIVGQAADSGSVGISSPQGTGDLGGGRAMGGWRGGLALADKGIAEARFGNAGAPAFIHREIPEYPPMARRLGKEGKVLLRLLIDKDGKLREVEVMETTGSLFTEAAVAAARKSTYAPARRNGERVAAKAILPFSFTLQ